MNFVLSTEYDRTCTSTVQDTISGVVVDGVDTVIVQGQAFFPLKPKNVWLVRVQ